MENYNDEIGRIRQILFGHNVSEIEKRIEGLEQQMQKAFDNLELRIGKIKDDISATKHQLDELKVELNDANQQSEQNHKAVYQSVVELGERLNEEVRNVRKTLSDTASDLRSEHSRSVEHQAIALSQLREQLSAKLSHMQASKVERTALALLLNELAQQLGNQDNSSSDQINHQNE